MTEPLTNIVTDAIAGYKAGLAGEPMGMVSEAFDCGWLSGDKERAIIAASASAQPVKVCRVCGNPGCEGTHVSDKLVPMETHGAGWLYTTPPQSTADTARVPQHYDGRHCMHASYGWCQRQECRDGCKRE